jgi:hypothetical protein
MACANALVSLLVLVAILIGGLTLPVRAFEEQVDAPEQGCTFRVDPSEFVQAQSRARTDVFERASKLGIRNSRVAAVLAESVPRRNFIDEEILGKLQRMAVPAAPRSSDQEFIRRIYFDITGRIPSSADVRSFLESQVGNKRDELIDKLLYSPEFNDKWSVWFMDLISMTEGLSTNARRPQIEGRNSFNGYIRDAMANLRPIRDIVVETITATGNNYYTENGPANFAVLASTAMGPIQDTYDMMLSRTASAYLGLGQYDCLLCHSGRGHLEALSLWAQRTTRMEAQRMAAHFSRMTLAAVPNTPQYEHPLYNSTVVGDNSTGTYNLNVTFGNRPARCAPAAQVTTRGCVAPAPGMPATMSLTPEYRDGSVPGNANWRAAFAQKLIQDPRFGRNFANRVWKAFFNLGLVDPVDSLDPDRLDPRNPPAAPWTLQATHPELLEKLAQFFSENNTDLRVLIRLMTQSSAYQMSSQYSGAWKLDYVPLFARHYPRRLQAEEIHDAIVKASGVLPLYSWPIVNGQTVARGAMLPQSVAVNWAMQLPDTNEPRLNTGNAQIFMAAFLRGNRDTAQRAQAGSVLQQLYLMNDALVTNRIKVAASPVMQEISKVQDNKVAVEEVFLQFLSRMPGAHELATGMAHLAKARNAAERNAYLEDLAWVCINKVEFLFSY